MIPAILNQTTTIGALIAAFQLMITRKAYKTFLAGAIVSGMVTLLILLFSPELTFNISLLNIEFTGSYRYMWLLFSFYLLTLSGLYFLAYRWKLKTRRWVVISHYTFSILLLLFFTAFSLFDTPQFQTLVSRLDIPFFTIVSMYAFLLISDLVLLIISILLLFANLFFLGKSDSALK